MRNKAFISLIVLCFIDALGVGILLPIFPNIFYEPLYGLLVGWSNYSHSMLYGLALVVYPLGTLFGMPIIGAMADKKGQKNTLILGLKLELFGFIIAIVSLYSQNLIFFIISRVICGFAVGNYAVINSIIVKVNNNKDKSLIFRYPILAFILGSIIGPILGGYCISIFNTQISMIIPFIMLIIFSIINLLMLRKFLKDDNIEKPKIKRCNLSIKQVFESLFYIFYKKDISFMVYIFLIFWCMQGVYTQSMAVTLNQSLHYDSIKVSYFFTTMAIASMFSILYLQIKISRILKSIFSRILFSLVITIIMFFILTLFVNKGIILWIAFMVIYVFSSILNTNFYALFSLKVPDSEQGRVFGGIGQIQYIGYIFGGVIISISNISVLLITVIPLVLCCLALFLILIKTYKIV
ncbi:MFS transporter [Francisella philomiragia]|uniref:MFS transporter n=1 Tax=Francisella philomiragia TaxID=28110 RepID=UPI001C9DC2F5|nr:MFS transporter [Francisella philomiragia]MBY7733430.1 MFS transporter [Francisella philomiragia]